MFYYEVQHSDGDLIQRVVDLSDEQIEALRDAGFYVLKVPVAEYLPEWLQLIVERHRD